MPSTYTTSLRLTLPATGELAGTWGSTVNTGITTLTETAIAGTAAVTMTDADYTLTTANGAADQARNMFVTLSGTLSAARNVICPSVSKLYFVTNSTTGGYTITFKTATGTGVDVPSGQRKVVYCNGTNVLDAFNAASTLALSGNLTLNGGTASGVVYLNGSKVATSGSALSFDGTDVATSGSVRLNNAQYYYGKSAAGVAVRLLGVNAGNVNYVGSIDSGPTEVNFGAASTITAQYWSIGGSEGMRLTSTGLGIGTATPVAKLQVVASTANIRLEESGAGAKRLEFSIDSTSVAKISANQSSQSIAFETVGNERMRIDSSGNLGVGTSSPGAKLDVNGTIYSRTGGVYTDTLTAYSGSSISVNAGSSYFGVTVNGSERMRIDSSGNVGIGTALPGVKLDVRGSVVGSNFSAIAVDNTAGGAGTNTVSINFSNAGVVKNSITGAVFGNGYLAFATDTNTERMRLDASGNLGLGVTPSAWAVAKAIDISGGALAASSNTTQIGHNAYYDGAFKYKANGFAAEYRLNNADGSHRWYAAPNNTSGANAALSFTHVMTLDASGNLGVGTANPAELGAGYTNIVASNSTGAIVQVQNNAGTNKGGIACDSNGTRIGNRTGALPIIFTSGANVETMRLDSSGNLGLGVTPSAWGGGYKSITNLLYGEYYSNNGGSVGLAANAYNNGTNWIYKNTTYASRYEQLLGGGHQWYNAPSGTAGNAITFTQAMTLAANGNLSIGETIDNGPRLQVYQTNPTRGVVSVIANRAASAQTGSQIQISQTSVADWAIGQPAGVSAIAFWGNRSTGADGTEYMRLNSSGNLGIGTTNPQTKLHVVGAEEQLRVQGATNDNAAISMLPSGSAVYSWLRFYNAAGTTNASIVCNAGTTLYLQTPTNGDIYYQTGSGGAHLWTINSVERMRLDTSGNLGVGTASFGTSAAGVIGIANGTAPTTSPAGMGQLYVEGGALKYRGSSGTVTTIAAA